VNEPELVPVPLGVVTEIFPVVAPEGTVTVILVEEFTVNVAAATPLNFTAVAPVNDVPVIVTEVPTGPFFGAKFEMSGATVKDPELVPVPLGVVTEIGPVVAFEGTVAVIWVSESTVNVALVLLNFTAVAPVNVVPVIVTEVPTEPPVGVKLVTPGVTVNDPELVPVPLGVVTEIFPVAAPDGTVAVILALEFTVKAVAATPLNFTAVAPVNVVPVIVTEVPTGPLFGEKPVMPGVTLNEPELVPVPFGVVTEIVPVVAFEGTVAVIVVLEFTVYVVAATPLNFTAVAPVNEVPVIVTEVPTGPLVGAKLVTVGAKLISWDWAASEFPALSMERNFTVVVWETVNEPW